MKLKINRDNEFICPKCNESILKECPQEWKTSFFTGKMKTLHICMNEKCKNEIYLSAEDKAGARLNS